MNNLFRSGALAAAVISVAVACGGGTSPTSPARTASPSSAAPSASSAAPSVAVPATVPASSPAGGPSLAPIFSTHGDPALEALLPATLIGTPLTRYSLTLTQLLDAGGDRVGIDAFLQGIGKTEADGSYAAAFDPTNGLGGGISAFKVTGADAAALLAGITELEKSDLGTNPTVGQATLAGKNVTSLSVGDGVNDNEWVYGHGEVVFVVHAANEAEATAFLSTLP